MTSRHYRNRLQDSTKELQTGNLQQMRDELLDKILKHSSRDSNEPDTTVYTGDTGKIVLLLRLFRVLQDEKYLLNAADLLESSLRLIPKRIIHPEKEISFIEGYAGVYSVAAVVKFYQQKDAERKEYVSQLLSFFDHVRKIHGKGSVDSNELLYGRAGYIHALLYCYNHTNETILLEYAEEVVKILVKEGRRYSKEVDSKSPLMYSWHDKRYTGFAHGITGILYMIISVYQLIEKTKRSEEWEEVLKEVQASTDFIASTVFPSGNYPTRDDGVDDKLVQWCHGAPAAVLLFCKAYEIFKDEKYKSLAWKACDVVWERGLLRKGYGLCHGISGNAYCFLYTYKISSNDLFLHRALSFASFAWDDEEVYKELISMPESPHSLFEGIGGHAYLLNDLFLLLSDPSFSAYAFPSLE